MSSTSGVSSITDSPLPKWQLVLAVGAPVALGLGYMYYRSCGKPRRKARNASKENGKPKEQISIDGDSSSTVDTFILPKTETPKEKAQRYKSKGNEHFKMGKYDEAIAQYNVAIEVCPKEDSEALATFYQNRAAAYEHLKKYSSVKADCTKALELNPRYTKALIRRARALEHCNELEAALEDVTTACIFEAFSNQSTLTMADRVLRLLGKQHAEEHLANKKLVMPSKHFVKTYMSSFLGDPIFTKLDNDLNIDESSTGFARALQALKEQNYEEITSICTEEIEKPDTDILKKMDMLLLRATFYLLHGQHELALKDFETIMNNKSCPKNTKVNALVKRATLYMQLESREKCFEDFDQAIDIDSECGDIYHHRGQVNLLLDNIDDAKEDFTRAVQLHPNYGVAYVQKCYADYRYAVSKRDVELIQNAMKDFEEAFKKFPDCPECYTLYAQMLSEKQEFKKADSYFAKAIEKDPKNATVYVHRGLLQLQWNGNIEKAIEHINKGIELDPKCEFGYETLGTIEVQRGNLKEAISLFEKAIALGRTSMELTHLFSLRDAAKSQLTIKDRIGPEIPWNMQNMS